MSKMGTYVLFFKPSAKFYVGSTRDIDLRVSQHRQTLQKKNHANAFVQAEWNSGNDFIVWFYPKQTRELAFHMEEWIIKEQKDNPFMLNIGLGVFGGDNLSRNPNRADIIARMKVTLAKTREDMGPEKRKELWSMKGEKNPMYGKTHSAEVLAFLSENNKGRPGSMLGKRHTDEARQKLSEKAKMRTGESNHFYGKHHSAETREKISLHRKGKVLPWVDKKPVNIDGVSFISFTAAAQSLGVSIGTISFRIKSLNPKFSGYTTECPTTIETTVQTDKGVE